MSPRPAVTVGPLDRDAEGPRLNWFLYRIAPNAAFRNMEPPRTGSRTARGSPPLAVELHYLLTAFPAELTATGEQEQIAHVALTAAMRRLHDDAIVAAGSPFLPSPSPTLVEPLRITFDTLDLETLSKLWTAASRPLRLSLGYSVSLVVAEPQRAFRPGPPVRTARVVTVPSLGPRLRGLRPARLGADAETEVTVDGATAGIVFRLAAEPADPAPAPLDGWPLSVVGRTRAGFLLRLPRHDLAPGVRRLDALAAADGLLVGGDSIALTVVPTVLASTTPAVAGQTVTLTTAHCAPDTELFVDATSVPPTTLTPTTVSFVVPAGPVGPRALTLRSGRVAGPAFDLVVAA